MSRTILRKAEYAALENIELSGKVLDLGGGHGSSEYFALFKGDFSVTTANIEAKSKPDILCDLEKPLPLPDASYNAVLLINVLEHIFEYRRLLNEVARVLMSRGKIVIIVPFMFPFHGSPHDYHRYTSSALERALTASGFSQISIIPLGSGVCAARWAMIERLLPDPLRFVSALAVPFSRLGDFLLTGLVRLLGKSYLPSDYALGYAVTAIK